MSAQISWFHKLNSQRKTKFVVILTRSCNVDVTLFSLISWLSMIARDSNEGVISSMPCVSCKTNVYCYYGCCVIVQWEEIYWRKIYLSWSISSGFPRFTWILRISRHRTVITIKTWHFHPALAFWVFIILCTMICQIWWYFHDIIPPRKTYLFNNFWDWSESSHSHKKLCKASVTRQLSHLLVYGHWTILPHAWYIFFYQF